MTDEQLELAAQIQAAAADMRRHMRLPEDAVITVVPPAQFIEPTREALGEDPTLVVSDEKAWS
jgi:hypothetical protein